MNKIYQYIDRCIIDEYASHGQSLDITSIPTKERNDLIALLMEEDSTVCDLITYHLQRLVDERIVEKELNDRIDRGIVLNRRSNGDMYFSVRRGAAC